MSARSRCRLRTASDRMPHADVVVVTFNSTASVRAAIAPLAGSDDIDVIVVDNASSDGTLRSIGDLAVRTIALDENCGFAGGGNVGWRAVAAPWVLFLNPDTRMTPDAVRQLAAKADGDPATGAVGPRLVTSDGEL